MKILLGVWLLIPFVHLGAGHSLLAGTASLVSGTVVDSSGAPVQDAAVQLLDAQGNVVRETLTDAAGSFVLSDPPTGSLKLSISAPNLQGHRMVLNAGSSPHPPLQITLELIPLQTEVSVTASRGTLEVVGKTPHLVTVKDKDELLRKPLVTIGSALEGTPGTSIQQSTYGQVSPFLRGLTGNQVLNLVDGVRFNNSTYRFGPNQYLAFLEPSQVQQVEVLLGPTSSQYGSDALGGTVHVLTVGPDFSATSAFALHGQLQLLAASADASEGANALVSLGNKNLSWLVGASGRKHNDLRAGGGRDSHHVFHRYFGLSAAEVRQLFGGRLQDTAFSQAGGHSKLALRLPSDQSVTLWYQHGLQLGVRGYKDLLGGRGQLQSRFEPQALNLFYVRYEKQGVGRLDSLAGTFSVNTQRDGTVRQGLLLTDSVMRERSVVDSYGYTVQATSRLAGRQAFVFGSEVYQERIRSRRRQVDVQTGQQTERRALYPNGSHYTTLGLFGQDTLDVVKGRLRAVLGARFTQVKFRTFAERNRSASGQPLGVLDSFQTFHDLTFNAGLTYQIAPHLGLNLLTGRGFRAPNLNDLGAIGLSDLGYELPASEVTTAGALIGTSSGENAASTGKRVEKLSAERLYNYELGITVDTQRLSGRAHVFDAALHHPIVRRTLLFPAGNVPMALAGVPVFPIPPAAPEQPLDVVAVRTDLDSRAVKAFLNHGHQRFRGLESLVRYPLSSSWRLEASYTFLSGLEGSPQGPVRRLPPQQGTVGFRFTPSTSRLWIQMGGTLVGPQRKLSPGDRSDERIGAERSRRDIASFFNSARVKPYLRPGEDGLTGTSDDLFFLTGETLGQIQDRVLPLGSLVNGTTITNWDTRVPLFWKTPGYFVMNLSGGIGLGEHSSLTFAVSNLMDRNYRVHGSGIDSPGISFYLAYKIRF
ncbi:MAG: TonB-dependent receptor [Acidobacteriota bacterium]